MSWGYPDGCTQHDHDRAFDELGPSPGELAAEADAENDFDRDYPDGIVTNAEFGFVTSAENVSQSKCDLGLDRTEQNGVR